MSDTLRSSCRLQAARRACPGGIFLAQPRPYRARNVSYSAQPRRAAFRRLCGASMPLEGLKKVNALRALVVRYVSSWKGPTGLSSKVRFFM